MENQRTSHSWLSAFADRLMQLRPSMSAEQAVRRAVASIHEAAGLDPSIAADIFALARSPEAHTKRYRELFGARAPVSVDERRV
jgi:hypothetical protein